VLEETKDHLGVGLTYLESIDVAEKDEVVPVQQSELLSESALLAELV